MKIEKLNPYSYSIKYNIFNKLTLIIDIIKEIDNWFVTNDFKKLEDIILQLKLNGENYNLNYQNAFLRYFAIIYLTEKKKNEYYSWIKKRYNENVFLLEIEDIFSLINSHNEISDSTKKQQLQLVAFFQNEINEQINIYSVQLLNTFKSNEKTILGRIESRYNIIINELSLKSIRSAKFTFFNSDPKILPYTEQYGSIGYWGTQLYNDSAINRQNESKKIIEFLKRNNIKYTVNNIQNDICNKNNRFQIAENYEIITFSIFSKNIIKHMIFIPDKINGTKYFVPGKFNCCLENEDINDYVMYLDCDDNFPVILDLKTENNENYILSKSIFKDSYIYSIRHVKKKANSLITLEEDISVISKDTNYHKYNSFGFRFDPKSINDYNLIVDDTTININEDIYQKFKYLIVSDYDNNPCVISKNLFDKISINNRIPKNAKEIIDYFVTIKNQLTNLSQYSIAYDVYCEILKSKYQPVINRIKSSNSDKENHYQKSLELFDFANELFTKSDSIEKKSLNHLFVLSNTKDLTNEDFGRRAEIAFNLYLNENILGYKWSLQNKCTTYCQITWNNMAEESYKPFDFSIEFNQHEYFIDVKATKKYKDSTIYITINELELIEKYPQNYFIARMTLMEENNHYTGIRINDEFCVKFYKVKESTLDTISSSITQWKEYYKENSIQFKIEHFEELLIDGFPKLTTPIYENLPQTSTDDIVKIENSIYLKYFLEAEEKIKYYNNDLIKKTISDILKLKQNDNFKAINIKQYIDENIIN